MASSIVVPNNQIRGAYPQGIADDLTAVATAAKADIEALQAGGGSTGTGPNHYVRLATNAALSGGAPVYVAGTQTLTAGANGALTVDSVAAVVGDRIFNKNAGDSTGGIYVVTNIGSGGTKWVMTRAVDWSASADVLDQMPIYVSEGTVNAGLNFQVSNTGAFVLDTTTPTFTAFASPATVAPLAVTQGVAAAVGTSLLYARQDHAHRPVAPAAGTALTDTATQTMLVSAGYRRTIGTLSQGGALTVSPTGAVAGDLVRVTRTGTDAFAYAIINGGPGAGTLFTMVASKKNFCDVVFDGTNWALDACGMS